MAKSKNRNRFSFNLEWINLLSELPDEERLAVYDAIVDYANKVASEENQMKPIDTKCYQLQPIGFLVFNAIKKEIDKDQKVYNAKCLRLKENGQKGGRKPSKKPKGTNCNQMVFEEKEKKKEKESFPPHPLYKEKEINKEKEQPPNPLKGASAVAVAKEKIIPEFFSKRMEVEAFCMSNYTREEELRRLAEIVFCEWELANETDLSEKHLLNSLRKKIQYNNRQKYDKQHQTNRLPERRGTEPGANGPEIYSDTL